MPPSTKRSQRARRDPRKDAGATTPPSAADFDESSPSRPAKRRKKVASPSQSLRPGSAVTPASAALRSSDDDSPTLDDDQVISQVLQQLKSQPVQASKDHANAIHEANSDGVEAYAKVAALDWTFYITKLGVNIGRAAETAHGAPVVTSDDDPARVHIDLGPSKTVSREHAAITFDSTEEKWFLQVKGRNGAKVDTQPLALGQSRPLTSGEVIEIGNVEMMFVLPSEISALHIHSSFLDRCGLPVQSSRDRLSRKQPSSAGGPSEYKRPGTPPSTGSTMILANARSPAVSTPAVVVGANGVDLSQDENQHIKPQYSYAQMITQAILSAPDGKLNLNGIYNFIMDSYSYYRHQQAAGWQNSIRHNLSLNKAFDKVARSTDEPGKGMKWQIVPESKDEMVRNAYRLGRGGHRGSSAPSSPSQLNYITHGPRDMATRDSPSIRGRRGSPIESPSRKATRASQATPERSSHRASGRTSALTTGGSPLPRSRKSAVEDPSLSSMQPHSPTLASSYLQEDGASFVTPAPPRMHPKLAPPSTAQRPSQHMPTSSPAPFWKYADIGSTPMKPLAPYELSPIKSGETGNVPQSSSPIRDTKSPPSSPTRPQRQSAPEGAETAEVADEDEGFDLTKGFQSISSYHAPVSHGLGVANTVHSQT